MATTIATESDIGREDMVNDAELERLLAEKLVAGYMLMETMCPKCLVPLVKNHGVVPKKTLSNHDDHKTNPNSNSNSNNNSSNGEPVILPSDTFEQPFKPVDGVPICVACDSHVITQATEMSILEESGTLKTTDKGSIYVVAAEHNNNDNDDDNDNDDNDDDIHVIHLENLTEEDIAVGAHRRSMRSSRNRHKHFVVDIAETTATEGGSGGVGGLDVDGVEVALSPRMGELGKPIDVEEMKVAEEKKEYSLRREVATKILGAKMMQGWTIKETICDDCAMPLMEHKGKIDCVVCPAFEKMARKKIKQQAKVAVEKTRLQKLVQLRKELQQQQDNDHQSAQTTQNLEHIQTTVRGEVEVRAIHEDDEMTHRAEDRMRAIEEERARILALKQIRTKSPGDNDNVNDNDNDGDEMVVSTTESKEERARILIEGERIELERLEVIMKEEDERRNLTAETREKKNKLAYEEAKRKAQQQSEAQELAKEAKAIEAFDEAATTADRDNSDDHTEAMKKDQLVEEHRKRMASKLTLDDQIVQLEEERQAEALDARRLVEESRFQAESRMMAALEADAACKALAAEDAIRRAKEALRHVTSTKKHMISQTIELAEREAVAETEESIKGRFEDYVEPVILQTESEIHQERWETLRLEGRAIMTRRMMQGWTLTPEACLATECHESPLIEKNGCKECVVCGGSGSGTDGVFETPEELQTIIAAPVVTTTTTTSARSLPPPVPVSGDNEVMDLLKSDQEMEAEFEKKREMYSREIGKKMLQGWMITDASCGKCIMPLMMDDKGNSDICIFCGDMNSQEQQQHFDGSTIATKSMAETIATKSMAAADLSIADDGDDEEALPVAPSGGALYSICEIPSSDSDLVSTIQRNSNKQQPRRTAIVSADPPALKRIVNPRSNRAVAEEVIPLPSSLDFADAAAIQELVTSSREDDNSSSHNNNFDSIDAAVGTVANLFLRSPHGYDFQDFGKSMTIDEVKELVEIFLVTSLDRDVTDEFKFAVAERIISKMSLANARESVSPREGAASPLRIETADAPTGMSSSRSRFSFDPFDNEQRPSYVATKQRVRPCPDGNPISPSNNRRPPKSPAMIRYNSPVNVSRRVMSPRSDCSVASSVASDALESIYDRIDQCKKKLLDPNNNLDEQIATAALLEKLAQAAVAVKEMEYLE